MVARLVGPPHSITITNLHDIGPATPSRRGRRPIVFKNSGSASSYPSSLGFNEQGMHTSLFTYGAKGCT